MTDIFVSYTGSDRDWAFWIGQEMEKLGHTPHVHEWEIPAGGNIQAWMEGRLQSADRFCCVVSAAYLSAPYSSWERRAALWAAEKQRPDFVQPVFVENCEVPIWLANIKRCDLFGLGEDEARESLKAYLAPSSKPLASVRFPGKPVTTQSPSARPEVIKFPGDTQVIQKSPSASGADSPAGNDWSAEVSSEQLPTQEAERRGFSETGKLEAPGANVDETLVSAPHNENRLAHYRMPKSTLRLLVLSVLSLFAIASVGAITFLRGSQNSGYKSIAIKPEWKPIPEDAKISNQSDSPASIYKEPDIRSEVVDSIARKEPLYLLGDQPNELASANIKGETWLSFKFGGRLVFVLQSSLCQSGLQTQCELANLTK